MGSNQPPDDRAERKEVENNYLASKRNHAREAAISHPMVGIEREAARENDLALKPVSHSMGNNQPFGDRVERKVAREDDLASKRISRSLRMKTPSDGRVGREEVEKDGLASKLVSRSPRQQSAAR